MSLRYQHLTSANSVEQCRTDNKRMDSMRTPITTVTRNPFMQIIEAGHALWIIYGTNRATLTNKKFEQEVPITGSVPRGFLIHTWPISIPFRFNFVATDHNPDSFTCQLCCYNDCRFWKFENYREKSRWQQVATRLLCVEVLGLFSSNK